MMVGLRMLFLLFFCTQEAELSLYWIICEQHSGASTQLKCLGYMVWYMVCESRLKDKNIRVDDPFPFWWLFLFPSNINGIFKLYLSSPVF